MMVKGGGCRHAAHGFMPSFKSPPCREAVSLALRMLLACLGHQMLAHLSVFFLGGAAGVSGVVRSACVFAAPVVLFGFALRQAFPFKVAPVPRLGLTAALSAMSAMLVLAFYTR